MNEQEIKLVNKTARSAGAVGHNAIVPRVVKDMLKNATELKTVLDYGSGPFKLHTNALQDLFPQHFIAAHDIGENFIEGEHLDLSICDKIRWDIVFASNVINVQPSFNALYRTLSCLHRLGRFGVVIFNYPQSPRKLDLSIKEFHSACFKRWDKVHQNGGIFACSDTRYVSG